MTTKMLYPAACEAFADLLVDYSDNELNEEQRLVVSDHVAKCAGCRECLTRLDASRDQLLRAVDLRASDLAAKSGVQLREALRTPLVNRRHRSSVLALTVTVASAFVGLSSVWWFTSSRDAMPIAGPPTVEQTPVIANAAARLTPGEAHWHVALFEQQARLEASLDLLPRDGVYAQQREQDEQLLAKFQTLVRDIE